MTVELGGDGLLRDRLADVLTDPRDLEFQAWAAQLARNAEEFAAEVDRLMPGFVVDLGIFNVRQPPFPCPWCGTPVVLVLTWEQELTAAGLAARTGRDGRGRVEDLPRHAPSRCRAIRDAAGGELPDLDQLGAERGCATSVQPQRRGMRVTRAGQLPGVSAYCRNTELL
jgi:hypothetical protein